MAGKLMPKAPGHIPFSYRAGKTKLHRIPAIIKLLCVIVFSFAAFSSVYGLAAVILVLFVFSIIAHIPPWQLLKGSKPLIILSLCIVLIKSGILESTPSVSMNGILGGVIIALRILVTFAAAALLFSLTTMRELRLDIAAIEIRLKKFFGKKQKGSIPFFSLGICLMLGFIPRFFELWETANLACEARSSKRGIRRLFLLVPLITERMMESAADTALALEARGLGIGE
jgi:biotin transport system permease protein